MNSLETYLARQTHFIPLVEEPPDNSLQLVITLPAYKEERLNDTITSIAKCCLPGDVKAELLVLVNEPEDCTSEVRKLNHRVASQAKELSRSVSRDNFHCKVLEKQLPVKHAGAGFARKILMDEATYRFNKINNERGIIVSCDADAIYEKNYLSEIVRLFNFNPDTTGCSVYFEHDVDNPDFSGEVREAASLYELYLRYYNQATRSSGFPHARHTVGSAFAVSANVYSRQGGMNKRQGGEDFYFLHKVIPLGNYHDLQSTRVILSPRPSDRAPFGTGATVRKMMQSGQNTFLTYNYQSFVDLRDLFERIDMLFQSKEKEHFRFLDSLSLSLQKFLQNNNWSDKINEINANVKSVETFRKRFFHWFNAFRFLKFLNYSHEIYYQKEDVRTCVLKLLSDFDYSVNNTDIRTILESMRRFEKNKENY